MATGWAKEGAVLEQIDATIKEAVARARIGLSTGPSLSYCVECGGEIPIGRQQAIRGVRFCVSCQEANDRETDATMGYNRRGSKDSQLR